MVLHQLSERERMSKYLQKSHNIFALSPVKLIVMSVTTLGVYNVYWFYKNWRTIRNTDKFNWGAFILALFSPVTAALLFKRYINVGLALLLAATYFLLNLAYKIDNAWWLVALLGFGPLLIFQSIVKPKGVISTFSRYDIAFALVGSVVLLLFVVGTFLPY